MDRALLFKIRLKRETNLMQACSANQHQVIMPSWLPKVPSWLRKNALCLSQSAFSNFALHVIKVLKPLLFPEAVCAQGNDSLNIFFCCSTYWDTYVINKLWYDTNLILFDSRVLNSMSHISSKTRSHPIWYLKLFNKNDITFLTCNNLYIRFITCNNLYLFVVVVGNPLMSSKISTHTLVVFS